MSHERTIRSAWLGALAAYRLIDDEPTFADVVDQVLEDGGLSHGAVEALRSISFEDVLEQRCMLPPRTRATIRDAWLRVFACTAEIVDEDTLTIARADASAGEPNTAARDLIQSISLDDVAACRAKLALQELTT